MAGAEVERHGHCGQRGPRVDCPMHESIRWGAQQALLSLAGVAEAEVEVVWDPPWHPSMMTAFGREATGAGNF